VYLISNINCLSDSINNSSHKLYIDMQLHINVRFNSKSSQVNDVDRRRLHLSLYVHIVLKTLVLIFNNLNIKLRSISGTGKVGSVINFHILELPKVIKSRLKYFNRVNINYSIGQTVPNINYSISKRELSKSSDFCFSTI